MFWKIFIIQPYTERPAAHEFFADIITFFIMKQVKIINISACTDCLMYFDLLLFCRIDLCLEALQQSPHPFLSAFYIYEGHIIYRKMHAESFKPVVSKTHKSVFMCDY